MLQSTYLFRILPVAALLFCVHAGFAGVKPGPRSLLQRIYIAELGVKEISNRNDGMRVEEYLRYVGLPKGNPWCAAFVCWALGKAGLVNPRSGWSPHLFPEKRVIWTNTRQLNVKLPGKTLQRGPQTGDVFGIYFSDKKRIAHCGFVDSWKGSWIITVEGNTNLKGSREGDGVYMKRRLISTVSKVADWVADDR